MDAFALPDRLVEEYKQGVGGFIAIKEKHARRFAEGRLWPEPLVQINPAFRPEPTIDQLVENGALHPECERILRRRGGWSSWCWMNCIPTAAAKALTGPCCSGRPASWR